MMQQTCPSRCLLSMVAVLIGLFGRSDQSPASLEIHRLSTESIGEFSSSTLTFTANVSSFTLKYRSVEPLYLDPSQLDGDPQTFALSLGGYSIGVLQVERNNCTVEQSNTSLSLLFRRFVMLCRYERVFGKSVHVLEANITIFNPTVDLNGSQVIVESIPSRRNGLDIKTAAITIKYCDPQVFDRQHLQLKRALRPTSEFRYGEVAYLKCSTGLLFKHNRISDEDSSNLLVESASQSCGPHGEWEGPALRCWQGQTLVLPSIHNFVDMDDRPSIFVCQNTNKSHYSEVSLKVGDNKKVKGIVPSQVAWQNLSLAATRPKHPVTVRCEERAHTGEITIHETSVHISHYNITHIVHLGSTSVFTLPVPSKEIKLENIHITKDGESFHNFKLVRLTSKGRHHTHHAIAFNFQPAVTKEDLGNYIIRMSYSGRTIERLLHIVDDQSSVSKRTVTGVVAGVIISILLLLLIVGLAVWKFTKGGRLVHSRSMEHVLADQDGQLSQDDVFYPSGDNESIKDVPTEAYQSTSFETASRSARNENGYLPPSQVRGHAYVNKAKTYENLPNFSVAYISTTVA